MCLAQEQADKTAGMCITEVCRTQHTFPPFSCHFILAIVPVMQ